MPPLKPSSMRLRTAPVTRPSFCEAPTMAIERGDNSGLSRERAPVDGVASSDGALLRMANPLDLSIVNCRPPGALDPARVACRCSRLASGCRRRAEFYTKLLHLVRRDYLLTLEHNATREPLRQLV